MNKQLRVIVVDDEKPARTRLATLLERHPEVHLVAGCTGGQAALNAVTASARSGEPVDILFVDVQMPEMDGFAMLEALYTLPLATMPVIVFATAYDAYAVRAFDAHAVDYLLKPYSDERFEVALARAVRLARSGNSESVVQQMQVLLGEVAKFAPQSSLESPRADYLERLALKERGRVRLIKVSEIRWIAAAGVYITIHTAQAKYLHRELLSRLESQLDPRHFIRIHRSHIVNLDFVHELKQDAHGDYAVLLNDAPPLKVSRMYRSRLQEHLRQQL
jgi:two-component system, LytTR family, response regulator